ncbi:MAG: cysteine--tRNA ligase, partial [Nitrospirae bacterium]|nr:cysteine--tRNA ligase [Nitrospirota bacterium]
MLRLFNTYGQKIETFHPANKKVVNIFSCGPSVYQRSHIGNFRTFLFEDILGRYLEYSGYKVKKGMNLTDIEDKALKEAEKRGLSVKTLTEKNIKVFIREISLLRMKMPDYLPKASESVDATVDSIERLLDKKIAYRYKGNVYFDPLRFPKFGKLYGLDMSKWPKRKKRFHKDTYPGMQWNLGDFILWHGYKKEDKVYWDTKIGKGRPA